MERLTKRSNKTVHDNGVCCTHFNGYECSERMGECTDNCPWEEAVWSKLADYEDKQEQGLLIELPCKVGDTLYYIYGNEIVEVMVLRIEISYTEIHIVTGYNSLGKIGKTLFFTRSEAEEALAKMGGK